jgi:hypothetical protein
MPNVPYLLPASSWAGKRMRLTKRELVDYIPVPKLPAHITEVAADCGGFVATRKWGKYRYTTTQYVTWLRGLGTSLTWAAMQDYCCENEITSGKPGSVRQRQIMTTFRAWQIWQHYQQEAWAWVPTVQGWNTEDYVRHAKELSPLIQHMQGYYGDDPRWRVGIGTLCNRASASQIREIVHAVCGVLGPVPLHLWGVKLDAIRPQRTKKGKKGVVVGLPLNVVSTDSAAWNGLFAQHHATQRESGLTQRQYTYGVALPAYQDKLAQAADTERQLELF